MTVGIGACQITAPHLEEDSHVCAFAFAVRAPEMPKQNQTIRNPLQMFEVLSKDIFTCCAYCSCMSLLNVLCTINTNI